MNLTLLRSLGVAAVSVMSLTSLSVSAADETAPETESPVVIAIPNFDDDPENGIEHPLVEFIRTWEGLSGRELVIERFPFKRSMKMATTGQADFHFPLIRDPEVDAAGLPFDYSSTRITTVNFVLYTREGETVDMERPENYRLTTHGGHGNLFPFPIEEDYSVEGSLMKLKTGRIDGYIFADNAGDPVILELGLTGIQRSLYKVYDVHAVIERGPRGEAADQFITDTMNKAREATLPAVVQGIPYNDWQPREHVTPAVVQK